MATGTTSNQTQVGLVQINNSFSNQNYLPLSVGMLQVYSQQHLEHPEQYLFKLPIHKRVPATQAVAELIDTDVTFFSAYVWNFRISLEIARLLKQESPGTTIVFGGPHVPNKADEFFDLYPFVDIACHGEGEQVGLSILEHLGTQDWLQVPGISFIQKDGVLITNPKPARLGDLSIIASPYLSGTFEPLMAANPNEQWIALWETNRGCPFSCTFCDWGSATQSKVYRFDLERLYGEIDWFARNKIDFVFCCDANFGILSRDIEIAQYVSDVKGNFGYPGALSVQSTKNATERAYRVQKILSDAGLNKGVDIALQSMDTNTLKSIKRSNISTETYQELQRRFTKDGVETYTDIILGLPGESYDSFTTGVSNLIANGQHNRIQFNNLSILPNAEMGDPEYQKQHGMITVGSNTINIHGSLNTSAHDVLEEQLLVIGTNTMSKGDWVRARVFSWMAALLHFDKVLQIPLIVLHQEASITYRDLIETFVDKSTHQYPVLYEIRSFMLTHAENIQTGGPEYVQSEEWLNIWWPVDEYILIKLCVEHNLEQFYKEAQLLMMDSWLHKLNGLSPDALKQSFELNRSLIKLPFQTDNLNIELNYNLWEFYQSILSGTVATLEINESSYHVNRTNHIWDSWNLWCQEVIWYGNKKGAYLYGNDAVEPQLAGHF
jgi:radical SAM superfamily enzyme YgiQ (UPF0313 family)